MTGMEKGKENQLAVSSTTITRKLQIQVSRWMFKTKNQAETSSLNAKMNCETPWDMILRMLKIHMNSQTLGNTQKRKIWQAIKNQKAHPWFMQQIIIICILIISLSSVGSKVLYKWKED